MVIVPATMELLGDANWWLPSWLDRILPHLDVERSPRTDDDALPNDDEFGDPDQPGPVSVARATP
jgi:RND superfamily putative drug exporter